MKLAYTFKNPQLLQLALTHPSLCKNKDVSSYQTLEFLGDNVLNMLLAEALFKAYPDFSEGRLSQIHSNLVKTETLARIAAVIELGHDILMDKGEELSGGRRSQKNLEDCLEALIAAVFLEAGIDATRELFMPYWEPFIADKNYAFQRDAKSVLQEWSQRSKYGLPKYTVLNEAGLSHSPFFTVGLNVGELPQVVGNGSSIKKAETNAAQNFIEEHKIEDGK